MPAWWIAVALVSAGGTELARRYAIRRRLLDEPGDRRSHTQSTPRGGGAGLVIACLMACVWVAMAHTGAARPMGWIACGLVLVAAIGWWDDHRPLSPALRLAVHGLAAMLLVHALALWSMSPWLALAGVIATMALINVWNFMDGINGIAATQAALVSAAAAFVSAGPLGLLGVAVAPACLGFLPWNFPRARIFMGDVGSGSLGFLLAALLLAALPRVAPLVVILLALSAFLVDSGLTLLRRMLRRERWWQPHTQHLYQGWARDFGHSRVTLAYAAWTVLAIAVGLWAAGRGAAVTVSSLTVWYIAGAVLWLTLQRPAVRNSGEIQEKDR